MGRHGAPRRAADVDLELLGWGVFVSGIGLLSLGFAGVGWAVAVAVGTLVALVFGVVWAASATARTTTAQADVADVPAPAVESRRQPVDVSDL
jgi:hypothetical protein